MSQALKLAQFAKDNCVADGQIIMSGVHTKFDTQRLAFIAFQQETTEIRLFFDLSDASPQ
jgi:hypothetical protein